MVSKIYPDAPRVAVGAVVIHQAKVLLVLRGQAPAKDKWAIPGGSVHLGETLQAAAAREVLEETGLHVTVGELVYTFEAIVHDPAGLVQYHYVILDFKAKALDPDQPLIPADDVAEAAWFSLADLDRPDLALSEATHTLLKQMMNRHDQP